MSSSESIRSEVASAGKWSAISTVASTVLQFAKNIILAYLLSPAELGLFGMAMLAVNLFTTLGDGGMANAIIYKQTTDSRILSTIHWINVAVGLVVSFVVLLTAPLVAMFFKNPSLIDLLWVMAVGPVLISWAIVGQAVLRTEMKFAAICVIKVAGAAMGLIVSVGFALADHGVFAIAYGYVAWFITEMLLTAFLSVDYSRPRLVFQRTGLGEYLRFGGFQLGERFVNFFGANADYFIIGRFVGEEALGIYRIAYELVVLPLSRINPIVTQVVLPGFAKLKDKERVRSGYLQVLKLLATFTVPCLLGLWAIAPLFMQITHDARYASAADLVRILVLVGVLKTLSNPIGVAIVALGKPEIGFWWNIFVLAVSLPLFWVLASSPMQETAVAWGYVGLMVVCFLILNGPILQKLLPIPFHQVIQQVYAPVLISLVMALVVVVADRSLRNIVNPYVLLPLLIALGGITYVGLSYLWDKRYVRSVHALVVRGE